MSRGRKSSVKEMCIARVRLVPPVVTQVWIISHSGVLSKRARCADECVRFIRATCKGAGFCCKGLVLQGFQLAFAIWPLWRSRTSTPKPPEAPPRLPRGSTEATERWTAGAAWQLLGGAHRRPRASYPHSQGVGYPRRARSDAPYDLTMAAASRCTRLGGAGPHRVDIVQES